MPESGVEIFVVQQALFGPDTNEFLWQGLPDAAIGQLFRQEKTRRRSNKIR
jgi:hypothetical protein